MSRVAELAIYFGVINAFAAYLALVWAPRARRKEREATRHTEQ
jgi:hypothetical protein